MKFALSEPIINTLKVAGPAFFMSMQASSVQTALRIISDKSTRELSPLPFTSLFTNCVIWTYYGLLRSDNTVFIPNLIGIFTGAGCMMSYQRYSSKSPMSLYIVSSSIIAIASILAYLGNFQILGLIGCALAVILSGSPLATLKTVIKTKSTAALPFSMSLTTFFNALSWMLYGILVAHDPMIYGPNSLGLLLAMIQLSLFAVLGFGDSNKQPVKAIF